MDLLKVCTKCKTAHPPTNFSRDKAKKDGLRPICTPCTRAQARRYYENNTEKVKAAVKLYRTNNLEKVKLAKKLWAEKNRHRLRLLGRKYRKANPSRRYPRNKEKDKEYARRARRRKAIYNWWYGVLCPQERIRRRLRKRLCKYLRSKNVSTIGECGLTLSALLTYLNATCIDRYNVPYTGYEWHFHIDHIRPLASFDLLDSAQLAQAVHWSNLQVLRADDNLKKRAKYVN